MKRILVASDLSARADRAVARALQLARQYDAAVSLVHVIDEDLPQASVEALQAAASAELDAVKKRLDPDAKARLSVRVIEGQIHRAIIAQAQADGADLIILGIHRSESSYLPVIGSTMARVIHESFIPVLVVKRPVDAPYGNAMVAVDFSAFSRPAIHAADSLIAKGVIHLVHAYHVPFQGFLSGERAADEIREAHETDMKRLAGEEMETLAAEAAGSAKDGRDVRLHLIEGEVHAVLRRQAETLGAELLVMGTHGRTGLSRAWLGSVAEDFLVRPPCDVLVVKRGERPSPTTRQARAARIVA